MTIFIGLVPPFLSTLQWGNTGGSGLVSTFPVAFSQLLIAVSVHRGVEIRISTIDIQNTNNTKITILSDSASGHNWVAIGR